MSVKFKRKVIDLSNSLVVNIPKEIAEELGTKKGNTIIVTLENRHFCDRKEEK